MSKAFPLVTLEDKNSNCLSILATVPLSDYFELVRHAYRDQQGGLEGQRAPITTKTGLKIRGRLVNDLRNGAVIPPIVVGAVCSLAVINSMRRARSSGALISLLKKQSVDLSIIDGMQRTTALQEAGLDESEEPIRVELWVSQKVESLIYRMLVLNTGQVPWDLKRQLDTLYRPILNQVMTEVPAARIIALDEPFRRSQAGEYRSTRIIELFLAFTSRSIDVYIKERVAEEFAKIDITEATAQSTFMPLFIEALKLLIQVDSAFDRSVKRKWPSGRLQDQEWSRHIHIGRRSNWIHGRRSRVDDGNPWLRLQGRRRSPRAKSNCREYHKACLPSPPEDRQRSGRVSRP